MRVAEQVTAVVVELRGDRDRAARRRVLVPDLADERERPGAVVDLAGRRQDGEARWTDAGYEARRDRSLEPPLVAIRMA